MKIMTSLLTLALSSSAFAAQISCVFSTNQYGRSVEDIRINNVQANGKAVVIVTKKSLNETWLISANKVAVNDFLVTAVKSNRLGNQSNNTLIATQQPIAAVLVKNDAMTSAGTSINGLLTNYTYSLYCTSL